MHDLIQNIPVTFEAEGYTSRVVQWGDLNVEVWSTAPNIPPVDPAIFFKGLPDDRCQCPHYGVVTKGSIIFNFADRHEVIKAGEVYSIAPGHLPVINPDSAGVEFSPKHEFDKTMEVLGSNLAAMMAEA